MVMSAHLRDPRPRASAKVPDLPEAVSDVLVKAMAKAPDDRYRDCVAFAAALAAAAEPPPDAVIDLDKPAKPVEPVPPPASLRRWRRLAIVATIVAFVLVIAGVAMFPGLQGSVAAPDGATGSATPSATSTGTPFSSLATSPSATGTNPSPSPARSSTPSRSRKAAPAPPQTPSCRDRQQYQVTEKGEVLDDAWNFVGYVYEGDQFVRLDTPPNPPSPEAKNRHYGTINDMTGYVLKRKLALERIVCV